MPNLTWDTKFAPSPIPANLVTENLVYPGGTGYPDCQPENSLVLGDNLAVMSALLPDYENKIDLIYADPPFFTNRRYTARVGQGEDSRRPQDWLLAEGYPDHWPDLEAYLDMLYPRLVLMHRLLSPTGTFYLHLDWHANAYARVLLDEIFGSDHLLNEIVWVYHGPSPIRSAFNRKHDTILAYIKGSEYTFNVDDVRLPYDPNTVKTFAASPKAGFGKVPDLKRGKVPEDWWYFPVVARLHNERTGYPTQKPEALLERIILASSNPGDLVADFFCGAGTTAVVASKSGRRFLASDVTWRAVHTSRSRLVECGVEPFYLRREIHSSRDHWNLTAVDDKAYQLSGNDCRLALDPVQMSQLDYWEIGPIGNDGLYRSVAQAIRPRKRGEISSRLGFPQEVDGSQIKVRMVSIEGKQTQM